MSKRGEELRDQILWTAKDVFLEFGFERTSMDIVAARAKSSKRSLYAHFGSKERLFLAIVELVRGLLLEPLGKPEDYGPDPVEALTAFCARYAETWTVSGAVQMFRLNAAEAARFPNGATRYHEIAFAEVQTRIAAYICGKLTRSQEESARAAEAIMARVLFPRLLRSVFGLDELRSGFDNTLSPGLDLEPIRDAVLSATQGMSVDQ